ncbi:hypothetical protein ATK74_2024 [Propionicimonas paludicola]|uniref:Uncharacterized protein n=1 Tax=Propionicimonas paludicola TaxID=185243 RepID=A0A2A9CSN2_9ACTN|nr:hypothetical protein [Propionicimonas paludicola]PFG17453.1 hypothetical protein ATK74_2024 [Propionicimonas paludicola]
MNGIHEPVPGELVGSLEQTWPDGLRRAVLVLVTDTLAWGLGLAVAMLSAPVQPGLVWFALVAAMTQLAVGQAAAGHQLRLRTVVLGLIVAVATASGFALAVSAQLATDWRGCLVLAASASAVSLGARALYLVALKARQAQQSQVEPDPVCTFADTLDLHWLPQLEIRTARVAPRPQMAGADLRSRTA